MILFKKVITKYLLIKIKAINKLRKDKNKVLPIKTELYVGLYEHTYFSMLTWLKLCNANGSIM